MELSDVQPSTIEGTLCWIKHSSSVDKQKVKIRCLRHDKFWFFDYATGTDQVKSVEGYEIFI